jgi:hypothetical protein
MNFRQPVLPRGELAKILHRAEHHVIKQAKDDSASQFRVDRDVELRRKTEEWRHQAFSEDI